MRLRTMLSSAALLVAVAVLLLGLAPSVFAEAPRSGTNAADQAAVKAKVDRIRGSRITLDERQAAAARLRLMQALAKVGSGSRVSAAAVQPAPGPGGIPDYFGTTPNWAYSPLLRKFVDRLPGLGPTKANNLGQYIPVGKPDTTTYPGSDYYEIELRQFTEKVHSDLPATTFRGYVQVNKGTDSMGANTLQPDPIHYLGPFIVARKDRPVRIKFANKLATGTAGDLFIPVDTSVMGAGMGPVEGQMYTQNRATLHLHGGITPWISDGTPHQWITPAGEDTPYPKGVSVKNVPDMPDPGDGSMTFYYTNQQSARLMFYHDHSFGITRLNVYAGEAAGYMITDPVETKLVSDKVIPSTQIPLIIQDKTFVDAKTITQTDPTWNWGKTPGTPHTGDLWVPHVYVPAQNPAMPDGVNPTGRWHYGPWFWPPVQNISHPPISNPYYDPINAPWEPPLMPATPNPSMGMEAYNDTPIVNGTAYPVLEVSPKAYRFRILNAANDRFFNLQMYVADGKTRSKDGRKNTEVKMVQAKVTPGFPELWPTDARVGGVPDPRTAGPKWIQIGTESGFLPKPAIIPQQPVTWVTDPTVFNMGNVQDHSLLLGTAERADVIVDFSKYAGKTLILYNDAPTAFPALDQRTDYFTGLPDMTDVGGPKTTKAGYGPNTRTIMQIKVKAAKPATAFDTSKLNAAFASTNEKEGVFESSQNPIHIPDARYNTVYNQPLPADQYIRIYQNDTAVRALDGRSVNMHLEPKAIQDEQGEVFDPDYGRMSGKLGLEMPRTNAGLQNFLLYSFSDPTTELLQDSMTPLSPMGSDGTQIWKITHNGVDTHPIHFHLFDVQLINRVGWDGFIRVPDDNELGWKDTVRVSPLEDTIVALKPVAPKAEFGLPDSIRPLNPSLPIGSAMGFSNLNPQTGQAMIPPVTNQVVNFGWEYVWHCHILSHEEMDMMRPMSLFVARSLMVAPSLAATGVPGTSVELAWTDSTPVGSPATMGNPANEIGFRIERSAVSSAGVEGTSTVIDTALANTTSYTDTTTVEGVAYRYSVSALNAAGQAASNKVTVGPAMYFSSYTVSSVAGMGGSISPATTQTVVAGGDSPVFRITANVGFLLADVIVDGVSVGPVGSYQFTGVVNDHTIWALFAPNEFTITSSAGPHGTISPSPTQRVVRGSNSTTYMIMPDPGYHVARLLVDGVKVPSTATYTFTDVSANHTISVAFETDTFTIVPTAGVHGTISPDATQWIVSGSDSATFTITPDTGYYVSDVLVDGVSVGSVREYRFSNVTANHSFRAEFTLKTIPRFSRDRYANALTASRYLYPGWDGVRHVVIASGESASAYEAATAPGLAGAYGAPLLLVAKSTLRGDVRAALMAMPNGLRVHIVGGQGGVSARVQSLIRAVPGVASVDRVGGSGRYETAAEVARRMQTVMGDRFPNTALIVGAASEANLPDAVAASVISARRHFPLLYVTSVAVPDPTSSVLDDLALSRRYVIGDTFAVSGSIQETLGVAPADRIGSPGPVATTVALATRARAEGWLSARRAGFAATGTDAVWSGAYLGVRGAPFLLVGKTTVPVPTSFYLTTNKEWLFGGYVLSAKTLVSETTRLKLLGLIE